MTREEARNYLRSSGFSKEQIDTIEQAFLKLIDEIRTKLTEIRDLWAKDDYYDEADVLTLVLRIIDECIGGEKE